MSIKKRFKQLPYGAQFGPLQKHRNLMTLVVPPSGWRFSAGNSIIHGVPAEPNLFKAKHYEMVRR